VGERKALGRFLLVSTVFLPALCYESDTFRMLAINLILRAIISIFLPFEKNLRKQTILQAKMHNCSRGVVSNLRFIDLCDRGTLRPVRLCLTTPLYDNALKTM
jgi:hypothetical protein